jgi:hypothetical protein
VKTPQIESQACLIAARDWAAKKTFGDQKHATFCRKKHV